MINTYDNVGYDYRIPRWMKSVLCELVKVSKIEIRRKSYCNN